MSRPIRAETPPSLSVIIPTFNAETTLPETLESLLAQTRTDWEAVIVDDGSEDGTLSVANAFADRDSRVRVIEQPHSGVSTARNLGVEAARSEWLLFLDGDDWLSPVAIERFFAAVRDKPDVDAVHSRWARITPEGVLVFPSEWPEATDMFPVLGRYATFPIHACIVKRSTVQAAGGFDPSFVTSEDWDLWQRIARSGARFSACHEALAFYRIRLGSVTTDFEQVLRDGLRVLRLTHGPDPRVSTPTERHREGLASAGLVKREISFACWCGGAALGSGADPTVVITHLTDHACLDLDLEGTAESIVHAAAISMASERSAWYDSWDDLQEPLDRFLDEVERVSLAPGFARIVRNHIERIVLDHTFRGTAISVGRTQVSQIEITEPIRDIEPPESIERVVVYVDMDGQRLGWIELPVFDGLVTAYVLGDAIADKFAWAILGTLFERSVYLRLTVRNGGESPSVWRGATLLRQDLELDSANRPVSLHQDVGWTVFLQELWGRPSWTEPRFYDHGVDEGPSAECRSADGPLVVEVAHDLPDLTVAGGTASVLVDVGGATIGCVTVPAIEGRVSAQALRAAITAQCGMELARVAVREAVIGEALPRALGPRKRPRPGGPPDAIRARLAARAEALGVEPPDLLADMFGGAAVASYARGSEHQLLVVPRFSPGWFKTSVARRAALPVEVASAHPRVRAWRDGALLLPGQIPASGVLVYAPDLVALAPAEVPEPSSVHAPAARPVNGTPRDELRVEFEQIYAAEQDPWNYASPYEQTKYEQTLDFLPSGKIRHALELACSEGRFTTQLAPRVGCLIAADISEVALARARERCREYHNIEYTRLDITRDDLPGHMDLIVCSEVLYFVSERHRLHEVAEKLTAALERGGVLLMAHANCLVDDPDSTGFDWDVPFGAKTIGETFALVRDLDLERELRTPLYRIHRFRRRTRPRRAPTLVQLDSQPTELSPKVSAHVHWEGREPAPAPPAPVTRSLPILMYHRVSPEPAQESRLLRPYRVDPARFEEQLAYLRDAGYESTTLQEWRMAVGSHSPLAGRKVLLTFDDGYLDFHEHAWPLLARYGFFASVFLVAAEIGGTSRWDRALGPCQPLLGRREIHELQEAGVGFGAHGYRHRPMTGMAPEDAVRDALRAREILSEELSTPVAALAYPYGAADALTAHLTGACGYTLGLTCRNGASQLSDDLLLLPRIEVSGTDRLEDFILKLDG